MINHMNNYAGEFGMKAGYYGMKAGYFGFQYFHAICMLVALILTIVVLNTLRSRNLKQEAKALWVLISFIPIIGPIAFWIVNPREE